MLLFALVLLVAGGVIAYVGDRLGTYIGKKRLSAWGLRPRHTAMLYTVLSGGAIAVLTLCALIAYDHTVQTALLRGPELLAENRRLARENRAQRVDVTARTAQAAAADARAAAASQRAGAALRQALDAEGRLRVSLARLQSAQSSLDQSRGDLRRRQAQLGDARRRLAALNSSLGGTRADLRSARAHLRTSQRAVAAADHGVRLAQAQYDRALGTVSDLAQRGQSLSLRNAQLAAQSDALDIKNRQLLTQTTFLQGAHLIYHRGQELGRTVVPSGLTVAAVRQRLAAFLDELSQAAVRVGATPGDNGRAVRVVTQAPVGAGGAEVSEDDALDALAQNIAQAGGAAPGVVVIAAAHLNAFGGEQVPVEVQPYDDVLVFPRGAEVADTVVDGSLPEDQILSALQAFLTESVQTAARRQGIIPRPDPETGEPTVGERTDSAQTLALVKQIQRIGPGARVTARAAAPAYSSGPLRLQLLAAPPLPVVAPVASPPAPPAAPHDLSRRG